MGVKALSVKMNNLENNLIELSKFTVENDNKLADIMKNIVSNIHTDMQEALDNQINAHLVSLKEEINTRFIPIEKKTEEIDGRTEMIENKLDIFKLDTTGKFELYKSTARSRVKQLVGEEESLKYVLFYRPFISKIYSDIYNHFGVNNSESIKMKDSDTAISMAKSWKPSMKYVHAKIREYQNKQAEGILQEERSLALEKFLKETNGGNNIAI